MLNLQLFLILGLIISSEERRHFNPDKKGHEEKTSFLKISTFPHHERSSSTSSSSSSSSSSEEISPFSSWELSMFSQLLIDISLNRCSEQVSPDQVEDFKTYVEAVVDTAPPYYNVSKGFMNMYENLVECFRFSLEASNRKQQLNDVLSENNYKFDNEKYETLSSNYKKPSVSMNTTRSPNNKHGGSKKKGILYNVGHLFTKLLDNTMSIFSSIFERKELDSKWETKKEKNNKDKNKGTDEVDGMKIFQNSDDTVNKQQNKAKGQFYSSSRSSYIKNILNTDEGNENQETDRPQSAYWKRNNEQNKQMSNDHFHRGKFIKLGQKHFRSVFKSFVKITKKSCPAQVLPHKDLIATALTNIFYLLKEDSERRADKGVYERQTFSLNFQLQRNFRECSKVVKVAVD